MDQSREARDHKVKLRRILITGLLLLFTANIAIYYAIRNRSKAVTCFTLQEVATTDPRCLYILSNKVYFRGASRSSPHHGHPCGMDVTSIIPSFHLNNMVYYLDPNYLGDICVVQPTATPTRTPTPYRSPTPIPYNSPTQSPYRSPTPSPTVYIYISPTPLPSETLIPTLPSKNGDANGDGRVDGIDYVIWLNHYGQNVSGGVSQGDFDRNGKVDGIDYVVWLNNFGK